MCRCGTHRPINGGETNDSFSPNSTGSEPASKVSYGARRAVPPAKAERPLSVGSTDLRRDAGQRARRADSRACCPFAQPRWFDSKQPMANSERWWGEAPKFTLDQL